MIAVIRTGLGLVKYFYIINWPSLEILEAKAATNVDSLYFYLRALNMPLAGYLLVAQRYGTFGAICPLDIWRLCQYELGLVYF